MVVVRELVGGSCVDTMVPATGRALAIAVFIEIARLARAFADPVPIVSPCRLCKTNCEDERKRYRYGEEETICFPPPPPGLCQLCFS